MIPYSHQSVSRGDIAAVKKVLKSDWLTQGPKVDEFERALTRYTGARFVVVFSSGTAALQAAYFAAGIKKGDEVITTPLTFAATANAALWQGAKVVFADIEERTGNLDPREVEKKITKRTRAIVPVDYAGFPVNLDAFRKIARRHDLVLIEDAAHALGASYQGKRVGSIADMTMFSFHPVKSITTGEGGAVTTNRQDFYERLLLFRNHGITKDPRKFKNKSHGLWYYEVQELGLNYRMTDIQAALGSLQLKRIGGFLKKRKMIAKKYHVVFSRDRRFIVPKETKDARSAWHLYPIRLAGNFVKKRKEIFNAMRRAGIGAQVHYIPVYWHPYYRRLGYKKGICPNAERFYQGEISLPIFPDLTTQKQTYIVDTFLRALD